MRRLATLLCCLGPGLSATVAFVACAADEVTIPGGGGADAGSLDGAIGSDGSSGSTDGGGGDAPADSGKPCAPPSDPTKSALCIDFAPEAMKFETEPSFDGRGLLTVFAYDTAQPDNDAGGATPVASYTLPNADAGAAEADLRALQEIRFDNLEKNKVYVRVVFVDGRVVKAPEAGWWFGGIDLSKGLRDRIPVESVDLTKGAGTRKTMPLTALRRFEVAVTRTVTPIGNAQGPVSVLALQNQSLANNDFFGVASAECANLLAPGSSVKTAGFIVGKGPYFLLPELDDFGVGGGGLPAGSLTALDTTGGTPKIPAASKLTFAADAYTVTASIALTTAVPRPGAPVDLVTCP